MERPTADQSRLAGLLGSTPIGEDEPSSRLAPSFPSVHNSESLFFCSCFLNRALDPLVAERDGHDDEDGVEHHHHGAHDLGHLPVEDDDADEDGEQHEEEEEDEAAQAVGGNAHGFLVDQGEQQPRERKAGTVLYK